jgi:hypothetical protein
MRLDVASKNSSKSGSGSTRFACEALKRLLTANGSFSLPGHQFMNPFKVGQILVSVGLLAGLVYFINQSMTQYEKSERAGLTVKPAPASSAAWLELDDFEDLFGPGFDTSLLKIDDNWKPGYATMLFEATRMMKDRSRGEQLMALLEKKTRLRTKPGDFNPWLTYIFDEQAETPPCYADFKAFVYKQKDETLSEYFLNSPAATIRLDEVVWGGVIRDQIPPLKNPGMIPANEAMYLDDADVTFGISINGDQRAYPKRILAWHEMFKDTIGGQSVCGVY